MNASMRDTMEEPAQVTNSLSANAAYQLANVAKTAPQYRHITPR